MLSTHYDFPTPISYQKNHFLSMLASFNFSLAYFTYTKMEKMQI